MDDNQNYQDPDTEFLKKISENLRKEPPKTEEDYKTQDLLEGEIDIIIKE